MKKVICLIMLLVSLYNLCGCKTAPLYETEKVIPVTSEEIKTLRQEYGDKIIDKLFAYNKWESDEIHLFTNSKNATKEKQNWGCEAIIPEDPYRHWDYKAIIVVVSDDSEKTFLHFKYSGYIKFSPYQYSYDEVKNYCEKIIALKKVIPNYLEAAVTSANEIIYYNIGDKIQEDFIKTKYRLIKKYGLEDVETTLERKREKITNGNQDIRRRLDVYKLPFGNCENLI